MAHRSTRRHVQPDLYQMCHCAKWRYPHQLPCSGSTSHSSRAPAGWDQDPSAPDFLPYSASASSSRSRSSYSSRSHTQNYAPRIDTVHYNPHYYEGQTFSEVEFDPETDGHAPAPDSPASDRSRTDSHRSVQLYASAIDDGAAEYVLEPPVPLAYLPPRLRDDISDRYWNAEGDSTDATGIVFPAPFGIQLSAEAFYYPSAQSGRFMNRRGEYWAGGEA
ncbi:hypothetical protein FRC06_010951 [Ceratobasidium sp. 370]|nr:hypothetical protein FRC06_010951 [Ceratobasidium sp. 370]